jgi:hypothetical protein
MITWTVAEVLLGLSGLLDQKYYDRYVSNLDGFEVLAYNLKVDTHDNV